MYRLTQVAPHPVTATLVPPTVILESSKVILCTLSLKVKGGSTWNFKLCFGSFRGLKISMHYLNKRCFAHVFWLGICTFLCCFIFLYSIHIVRTGFFTFYIETAFDNGLMKERYKGGYKWHEDKEEDVASYWMTLRKGKYTLIWRTKLWIALCGEFALEEALDLS
jgi:hypothetical protein